MIDFSKIVLPKFSADQIEKIVTPLITPLNNLPIDVELIAEKLGFDLIPIDGLRYISSTDAYLSASIKEIAYDPGVVNSRIRFSIAHELGHFYLHKGIIEEVRFCNYDEWRITLKEIPGWFWGRVETQANEFAGKLLVPRNILITTIVEFREELKLAKNMISNDIDSIREFLAIPLSKRFSVSEDVIRIRLQKEDINPFELVE